MAVGNSLLEKFNSGKFRRCWKIPHRFSGSTKCYPCQGFGTFRQGNGCWKIGRAFGNAAGFSPLRPPQPSWVPLRLGLWGSLPRALFRSFFPPLSPWGAVPSLRSSSGKPNACAMTTKFLDNEICTFKILLSWRFPRKSALLDDFPLCPKFLPLKNEKFYFYCRLAVSEKKVRFANFPGKESGVSSV